MSPKSKFPLGSHRAKKSIGKILTFYDRGGKQKVRLYNKPSKPASAAQLVQRNVVKDKVAIWQAFSDVDKAVWASEAKALGDPWSGYTLFMSTYIGEKEMSHKLFSATHPDTDPGDPVAGDIILANGTPEWIRLPKGDDDKILTMKSGLPAWEPAAGGGGEVTEVGVKLLSSDFDSLALGDVDGKGSHVYAGTWVNNSGADCLANIIEDPAGGHMLSLIDASGTYKSQVYIDFNPGCEVITGIVEVKAKISVQVEGSAGYFTIEDKGASSKHGGYFAGSFARLNYLTATGSTGKLVDAPVDTWFTVKWYFSRLASYGVWWVDGVFTQPKLFCNAGNKYDRINFETTTSYNGITLDIKYVKVWNLNYV